MQGIEKHKEIYEKLPEDLRKYIIPLPVVFSGRSHLLMLGEPFLLDTLERDKKISISSKDEVKISWKNIFSGFINLIKVLSEMNYKMGLCHVDIKPANIMWDIDENGLYLRLCDFDGAQKIGSERLVFTRIYSEMAMKAKK